MNMRSMIGQSIEGASRIVNNRFLKENITPYIISKINESSLVADKSKDKFNKYLKGGFKVKVPSISSLSLREMPGQDILIMALIYYLADLNQFDYQLINLSTNIDLSVEDIILLLLIDNINDINIFCKQRAIYGVYYYLVTNLKKMSAWHRLQLMQ